MIKPDTKVLFLLFALIFLSISTASFAEEKEVKCTFESLSEENTQCWNSLFSDYIDFKIIFSSEVVYDNLKNPFVLFTALGVAKNIPAGTIILPYLSLYKGDNSIEEYYIVDNSYQYQVLYGLFAKSSKSSGGTLTMFGEVNLWQLSCDGPAYETDLRHETWAKNKDTDVKLCNDLPSDSLYYFRSQTLLSNMPVQIAYKYGPAGEANGIYDHLFVLKGGNVIPILSVWHDKFGEVDGEQKIKYLKDRVIEHSALHTPFEGETHYYWSLTAKRVYEWRGDQFVLTEESIDPLFRPVTNEDGSVYRDYTERVDEMRKLQARFDSGKEKWLGDPIEVAKRTCEKCKNFRVAFMKEGVAVVWADDVSGKVTRHVSIHLYKPLYDLKEIGSRSIWSVAYDEAGFSRDSLGGAMGLNPPM